VLPLRLTRHLSLSDGCVWWTEIVNLLTKFVSDADRNSRPNYHRINKQKLSFGEINAGHAHEAKTVWTLLRSQ